MSADACVYGRAGGRRSSRSYIKRCVRRLRGQRFRNWCSARSLAHAHTHIQTLNMYTYLHVVGCAERTCELLIEHRAALGNGDIILHNTTQHKKCAVVQDVNLLSLSAHLYTILCVCLCVYVCCGGCINWITKLTAHIFCITHKHTITECVYACVQPMHPYAHTHTHTSRT